jgi:hypothetical protein
MMRMDPEMDKGGDDSGKMQDQKMQDGRMK